MLNLVNLNLNPYIQNVPASIVAPDSAINLIPVTADVLFKPPPTSICPMSLFKSYSIFADTSE